MGCVCACEGGHGTVQIESGYSEGEVCADPFLQDEIGLVATLSAQPETQPFKAGKVEDVHSCTRSTFQASEVEPRESEKQPAIKGSCELAVNRAAGLQTESSVLYAEAVEAASQYRLLLAHEKLEAAERLGYKITDSSECPLLGRLDEWVPLVRRLLQECSPPKGNDGWSSSKICNSSENAVEEVEIFWCWEGAALKVVNQWICKGSLQQQIASTRDSHLLEHLWGGQSSGMSNQHADGSTLYHCIEKSPLLPGKSAQIILERVFCECLDQDTPCWVLAEKSPGIENFKKFSGQWRSFNIPPLPKGATRGEGESGRVIEPVDANRCRVTSYFKASIPFVVRILLTDFLVSQAIKFGVKMSDASWAKIISGWSSSGMDQTMKDEAHFYKIVEQSAERMLASKNLPK